MNMVYASTYLYLPQYLFSVSHGFPSTVLLSPWLNLFPGTLFFVVVAIVNGTVFPVSLSESSFLVYKMSLISWY